MKRGFSLSTPSRTGSYDITSQVRQVVRASGVLEGWSLIFVPHTTAGVCLNENADPEVMQDFMTTLDKLVPFEDHYRHTEGNSAAHIKSILVGSSVTVPIEQGDLALGTWQGLFFCEFDGPRRRQVWVQIVPGSHHGRV